MTAAPAGRGGSVDQHGAPRSRTPAWSQKLTLTVEEAAEVIGISRAHAYRCVRSGELRAVQLGRRLVVPIVAVQALLGVPREIEDNDSV